MSLRDARREIRHALYDLEESRHHQPVPEQVGFQDGPWQDDVICARHHIEQAVLHLREEVGHYKLKEG